MGRSVSQCSGSNSWLWMGIYPQVALTIRATSSPNISAHPALTHGNHSLRHQKELQLQAENHQEASHFSWNLKHRLTFPWRRPGNILRRALLSLEKSELSLPFSFWQECRAPGLRRGPRDTAILPACPLPGLSASQKFCCRTILSIFNLPCDFFFGPLIVQECVSFHKLVIFSVFLMLLISNFTLLWSEKVYGIACIFQNILRLNLWHDIWSKLQKCVMCAWKECIVWFLKKCVFNFLETESYYIGQPALELTTSVSWDYRHVLPCLSF